MYFLEAKREELVKMEYSYARRAQATLRIATWKVVATCEEIEPLREIALDNFDSAEGWQIIENKPHTKPIRIYKDQS